VKIRIPIPGAEIGGAPYAVEFDPAKIDAIHLARGVTSDQDRGTALEDRTKLILEFANPEEAPRWVKHENAEEAAPIVPDEDPELLRRLRDQAVTLVQGIPRRREEQLEMERAVVHSARRYGVTWNEIAKATGISAGWLARDFYGEPEPEGETDGH